MRGRVIAADQAAEPDRVVRVVDAQRVPRAARAPGDDLGDVATAARLGLVAAETEGVGPAALQLDVEASVLTDRGAGLFAL
jgi:hypothetical protein